MLINNQTVCKSENNTNCKMQFGSALLPTVAVFSIFTHWQYCVTILSLCEIHPCIGIFIA